MVRADDARLDEARAVRDLLARLPGACEAVHWTETTFGAAAHATRASVTDVADVLLLVWHDLVRRRLG